MTQHLGGAFVTFIRSVDDLHLLLATSPFEPFRARPRSKRVVVFLRETPRLELALPIQRRTARILCIQGREVFADYGSEDGPALMQLLERTFGKAITTRTWQTVERAARAAAQA
jgi:uncharacterized protein (DUF1697 family)